MLKFEVNSGKILLRNAIGTIISVSLLSACTPLSKSQSAAAPNSASEQAGFCYKGGKTNAYSCDPEKASAQADMRPVDIDEEWMQDKLAEVKKWMAQERAAIEQGKTKPVSVATTADTSREFISTVSVAPPNTVTPEIENSLRLSQQSQHSAALAKINQFLTQQPKQSSALLAKGIILSNKGDKTAAKAVFQNLIKSHPERPEAFNNLAVIYSEEGNFPQAIETLQQAFQTHPSYAQVHTNLKELYATLASQAYNKALDLSTNEQGPSLAMINQPAQSSQPITTTVAAVTKPTPPPVIKSPVTPEPVVVPINTSQPQPQPMAAAEPVIASKTETKVEATDKPVEVAVSEPTITVEETITAIAEKPVAIATALPTKPETVAVATPAEPQEIAKAEPASAEEAIRTSLDNWASAWRNKDHTGYVGAYTESYRPNARLNHTQWVAQRLKRLTKPTFIRVELNNISIKLLRDNLAEARFDQHYQSDNYKDAVKKRLMLVKVEDQWKISLERTIGVLKR